MGFPQRNLTIRDRPWGVHVRPQREEGDPWVVLRILWGQRKVPLPMARISGTGIHQAKAAEVALGAGEGPKSVTQLVSCFYCEGLAKTQWLQRTHIYHCTAGQEAPTLRPPPSSLPLSSSSTLLRATSLGAGRGQTLGLLSNSLHPTQGRPGTE